MVNPLVVLSWLRARANKPLGFLMLDENGTLPIDVTLPSEPHPYATDGTDLSTIFADADALYAAYHAEDYSHIHVGDYWPLRLTGTYRDYGTLTCQQGQTYYSDTNLTQSAGTASQAYDAVAVNDASIPGCHKLYCEVTISGTKYYCSYSECLEYRERTLNNALLKMEIAGINQYWRYGDSGSLTGNVPHLLLCVSAKLTRSGRVSTSTSSLAMALLPSSPALAPLAPSAMCTWAAPGVPTTPITPTQATRSPSSPALSRLTVL